MFFIKLDKKVLRGYYYSPPRTPFEYPVSYKKLFLYSCIKKNMKASLASLYSS